MLAAIRKRILETMLQWLGSVVLTVAPRIVADGYPLDSGGPNIKYVHLNG